MATESRGPSLGLGACTAIVIGNMVGSGFYLSPSVLAPYGLLAVGLVEVVAFAFSLFTIYGCGPSPVLCGLILMLPGIPVYVWQRREQFRPVAANRAR